MRLPWIKLVAGLCVIWLLAAVTIHFARKAKVTPESLATYVAGHPVQTQPAKARATILERVAAQLNALPYEDRRHARSASGVDGFFRSLTAEEQERFLDLTLPTGFKQMMDALNRMTPAKRQEFVAKALEQMKSREGQPRPEDAQMDANARKIMDQGFKSFYSEANADVKMDVAPLIEQLQKNLQSGR